MKTSTLSLLIGITSLLTGLLAAYWANDAAEMAAHVDLHASLSSRSAALAESAQLAANQTSAAVETVRVSATAVTAAFSTVPSESNDDAHTASRLEAIRSAARRAQSSAERRTYRRIESRILETAKRGNRETPLTASNCDSQCKEDTYFLLRDLLEADRATQTAVLAAERLQKALIARFFMETKGVAKNYLDAAMEYNDIAIQAKRVANREVIRANRLVYRAVVNAQMAHALPEGVAIDAVLNHSDGLGLWLLQGQKGRAVNVAARSQEFDTVVRLVAPTGEELARDDDGGGNSDSVAVAILPEAETYLVQVMSFGEGSGGYEVEVSSVPSGGILESNRVTRGQLSSGVGNGIWSFQGNEGQVVSVSAHSNDFDPVVRLFTSTGKEFARDDDSGIGSDALAVAILPKAREYAVHITAFGGRVGENGIYTLELATVGRQLELGRLVSATLGESDASGLWILRGAKRQSITVEASSDEFDTVIRILEPTGEQLAWDDDSASGTNSRVHAVLPNSGMYVIHVTSFDARLGTYTLTTE